MGRESGPARALECALLKTKLRPLRPNNGGDPTVAPLAPGIRAVSAETIVDWREETESDQRYGGEVTSVTSLSFSYLLRG